MSGNGNAAPPGISGFQPWFRLAFSGLVAGLLSIVTVNPRLVSTTVLPKGIGPIEEPLLRSPEAAVLATTLNAVGHQ